MPRKINYPGYQTGGSTGGGDPAGYLAWLDDQINAKKNELFELEMHMEFTPGGSARDMHPGEADELYKVERKLDQELDDLYRQRYDAANPAHHRGRITDPNRLLARPKRGLLPDFSQDPEYGRLRDKMGIKPTSAVMRKGFKGGLKSLLMAGAGAALNPISVLAEELMSPTPLGSGDIPDFTDEEKMKYHDRLDDLSRDSGINLPNFRDYSSRSSGDDVSPEIRFLRDRFEDASGMGALRRIGGLGRAGASGLASILSKLGGRMGGWDNRLRGEEEARESAELRASRDRVRALRDSVLDLPVEVAPPGNRIPGPQHSTETRALLRRLRDAMYEERDLAETGRASGGIIGLQNGGRADPDRRYRAGPEKLAEHAEKWRQNLEMDVLMGRKPSSKHPTIQFGGIYGSRAKYGGKLERFTNEFGEPDIRYIPREGGPTIEDLYTRALDVDPQIHPDSVAYNLIKESDPALYEKLTTDFPAQPVWERASGGIIGLQQGGPAPTASAVTSYGVPQQTAQQWANLTDRIVTEGQRPYQQYAGQRIAGFTQPEAAAMAGRVAYGQGMGPMGTRQAAQTLGQAGQMIGGAQQGLMGLQPQYAQMAGQFGAAAPLAQQQAQQAALGMGQLAGRAELQGQLAGAGMRTTGTTGQKRQDILGAGQATAGKTAQTAIDKFGTGLATAGGQALSAQQQFAGGLPSEGGLGGMVGMGTAAQQAGETGAGTMRDIGTTMAAPELQRKADLSQYMSQYTKGVTDPQLRALQEFQKQQAQELGSQAAQAGAFGGYRQAIQQGQQAQAATQQAADIIGKGQQEAFESAQQAFERDRAATAAGHGQRLTAEQQAAAQEQQGLQAQMGAQQQAAQMGDVGAARQLQGLQAQLGAAGQGAQLGMQGLAAQRAAEQAGVGMSQLGQQQGAQTAQAGTQLGLGALQAAQGAREQGWGTYGQMLGQQQGAIGAQGQLYGQMGGMGGQLAGVGGQQMQLGGQQQQQQLERLRGMEAAGEKQRQMQQQSLGMGYQDWQNQLNQERSNIGWQQAAMSGLPYKGAVTQSRYQPQLSGGAKALDTGLAGLGAYEAYQQGQQGAMPQSTNQQPGGTGFQGAGGTGGQGTGGQWQPKPWQPLQTGGSGVGVNPGNFWNT